MIADAYDEMYILNWNMSEGKRHMKRLGYIELKWEEKHRKTKIV